MLNLKVARLKKGMSQCELGRAVGFQDQQMISLIETGKKIPDGALLLKLSLVLKEPVEYLLDSNTLVGPVWQTFKEWEKQNEKEMQIQKLG